MIKFPCPGCQTIFNVTDDKAGKKGKCPKCQSAFTIPQPEGAAPPPVDPNAPVEIEPCPGCGAVLTVAAEFLGADVECPSCNTVFTAAKPGGKPKSKAVVSMPPPPPPPPAPAASAFSGLGGDEDEDEAPKAKKGKSKAVIDDDFDDAPKKKKRGKGDDDDDFDDGDDYDDKPKGKKGKNGLLLAAGIVHIVFALMLLSCGGFSFCGSAILGGVVSNAQVEKNNQMANDPFLKENKQFQDALKKQNEAVSAAKTIATVVTILGVGYVVTGILALTAGIGCITRKPFGKLLSFAAGPMAVLLSIVGAIVPMMLLPADAPSGGGASLAVNGATVLFFMIYAGFTIFAVIKGYKKEAGVKPKKKFDDDADSDDEAEEAPPPPKKSSKRKPLDEDEEDDLPPPPPKKLKKKPVEEDEDDDLPPPKKKAPAKDDFAFGDDEDEAPKPKKKKPRRDDDD